MPEERWATLRDELDADVRRVADRLRSLSAARLAGPPAPPENGRPSYRSRAQAARGVAQALADAALALDGAGTWPGTRPVPELADFAAGDMVAVTGHDLLAAMDLVTPDTEVCSGAQVRRPARAEVEQATRLLADLRRRL